MPCPPHGFSRPACPPEPGAHPSHRPLGPALTPLLVSLPPSFWLFPFSLRTVSCFFRKKKTHPHLHLSCVLLPVRSLPPSGFSEAWFVITVTSSSPLRHPYLAALALAPTTPCNWNPLTKGRCQMPQTPPALTFLVPCIASAQSPFPWPSRPSSLCSPTFLTNPLIFPPGRLGLSQGPVVSGAQPPLSTPPHAHPPVQ